MFLIFSIGFSSGVETRMLLIQLRDVQVDEPPPSTSHNQPREADVGAVG